MRAGSLDELTKSSGDWAFVDVGFARDGKTCGFLFNEDRPRELQFGELRDELLRVHGASNNPLNLVIEAPLSAAFTKRGNPAGRSMERQGKKHRYWYAGLGCQVMLAAGYLLRAIYDEVSARDVRLFEGFVSFKDQTTKSSHAADVLALRSVAWRLPNAAGHIVAPDRIKGPHADYVISAFRVFGFDAGVPPVIVTGG